MSTTLPVTSYYDAGTCEGGRGMTTGAVPTLIARGPTTFPSISS
ncbi:hypothetical protein [Nocardia wallacei]|nr:hypothetical protein [Nocardia wallacei]